MKHRNRSTVFSLSFFVKHCCTKAKKSNPSLLEHRTPAIQNSPKYRFITSKSHKILTNLLPWHLLYSIQVWISVLAISNTQKQPKTSLISSAYSEQDGLYFVSRRKSRRTNSAVCAAGFDGSLWGNKHGDPQFFFSGNYWEQSNKEHIWRRKKVW